MKYFFFAISFLILHTGYAQKSKFATSVDKNKILIGEPFQLTLKAFVSGAIAQWPVIDSIPHFEVLAKAKVDSQLNSGTLILNQVITLTSWDSGKRIIPSFSFEGATKTAPILINVAFAPFDTTQDYNDVKDIIDAAKPERQQWHWYLIGALLLLGLFILLFPGRKVKKEPTSFVPDANIYKASLAKLDALRNKTPEDTKVLYTELIYIFRAYLYKRKGIESGAKTTNDLAIQLKQLQLPKEIYTSLVQTLSVSDLVKFARWQPTPPENVTSIETIRQSIIVIENLK